MAASAVVRRVTADADRSVQERRSISGWYRTRLARLVLAIVVMVPLVYSAIYMWVMWDPTTKVHQMPVALVNLDGTGAARPEDAAGAGVVRSLVESQALDFHLVDQSQAMRGLKAGEYYFVIEIPHDFSETLQRLSTPQAAPALIDVTYNDNTTLMASNIGARAMAEISAAVVRGVAASTVGTLVDGVDALGDGFRQAAAGATRLHSGTQQLVTGSGELAGGLTDGLVPGLRQASTGADQIADGNSRLAAGLVALQDGTTQLGDGATQLADGIDSMLGTVDLEAVNSVLAQLQRTLPAGAGTDMSASLAQVSAMVAGLTRLQTGSRELAVQLSNPSAQYRSGVNQLTTSAQQLSAGSGELSVGMRVLVTGGTEAAAGSVALHDGARQVDSGARDLSGGLASGAEQAPDLGDGERRASLATLLSTPVESRSSNVAPAQFGGPGGMPVLLVLVSALIALVVFMCVRVHDYVTDSTGAKDLRQWVWRARLVSVVGLAVMGVVGAGLWMSMEPHPSPSSLPEVIVIVAAATLMNTAVVALLFTVFGYVAGSLASLTWIMVQLFVFGGVWMVETLPAPLRVLHWGAPMTYVRQGLIAAFGGVPGFWSALAVIVAIGLVASLLTIALRGSGWARYPRVVIDRRDDENASVDADDHSGVGSTSPPADDALPVNGA